MTTKDASPSSTPLTRLLSLARPLYERGDLSLSQLVPVHKSLCTAIVTSEDAVDASEGELALLEEGTEQEQLLILQYRMRAMHPLQALATMLLPFLLSRDVSEHLREALLEAVFFDESCSNKNWLPQCLGVLGLSHQWTTVCLVLVRLERCYPCSQVTAFISLKVLEGVQIALDEEDVYVLHPIVTWLLPLLDYKEELWTLLFQNYEETQSRALVMTAVLCSVLPSLLSTKLPVSDTAQAALPIQHECLWNLILYSLRQGMDNSKLMGGGFGQSSSQSKEQLLRRRGLHLLRLLVEENGQSLLWLKYVTCFEALEMETEQHLVDQVWDTVSEICVSSTSKDESTQLPHLEWTWISAMLSRVLLSDTPVLRKLGLYRFFSGHAGIAINDKEVEMQPTKKKKRDKKKEQAPLSLVSTDFCLQVIIPSYDKLGQSVGTNMQLQENGKVQVHDITPLFVEFLGVYVEALDESRRAEFFRGLFGTSVVNDLRLKTTVMVYEAVASVDVGLEVDQKLLQTAIQSFGLLFNCSSVLAVYRERLLTAFATLLSRSSTSNAVDPKLLLKILSLYPITAPPPVNYESNASNKLVDNPTFAALQKWLANLGDSASWASTVGGACASAFVMGQLFPPTGDWVPESGSSETERLMGGAIVVLCALATEETPSSLLWPAIHKGLSTVQPHGWYNANRTCRSLILLENACRLGVVSGTGNGELLVDQKEQMVPPPPNIESLLANAVNFIVRHVEALTSFDSGEKRAGSTRSSKTGIVSCTFVLLISQMQVLCDGYPSSLAVSSSANKLFKLSMGRLVQEQLSAVETVRNTALAFGALSCGADPEASIVCCRLILHLEFTGEVGESVSYEQAARSVFQYAKWGTLSYILRVMLESNKYSESENEALVKELLNVAEESVHETPSDALLPLFDCVIMAARNSMAAEETIGRDDSFAENLSRIITALFAVMADSPSGRKAFYMLDEICALLFRPNLLIDEFERLKRDGDDAPTPIRDAFRHLMEMAGKKRPHISKAVLCRISMAWLGNHSEEGMQIYAGLSAVPYRKDIANLLVHKEAKIEESSQQVQKETSKKNGVMELPVETNEMSVARGFILTFISRLPGENEGLPNETLTDLLHFVIFYLLDDVCLVPPQSGSMLMTGTLEYSTKIRAWQALCVLSRFVTADIAAAVCDRVFAAMSQNLHWQIRYFLEAFAIQFGRRYPSIFGRKLVTEIRRRNLSLQHISSLMIISGNLIVGRYKDDFFRQYENGDQHVIKLDKILAGVIPWLSSTQGFTRAISQLLVHKLIPLIIQIEDIDDSDDEGNDWFLKSIYLFLNENPEMKRLRKKQSKFFDGYNVDDACSPESLLCLEVDDGAEANPKHMIDAIKKCLEQVYLEAHEHEAPMWKQVADMLERDESTALQQDFLGPDTELVNFQRKIIPLDSLELDLEESRQKRLRNALGRKKQQLVVCASLIDKVPNLAGLARTSEIFAAARLVIPDTTVCRMDNFKCISVGAGEWIDIEECKESDLLSWLRKQKERGYTIVGLEQTSSSIPLSDLSFPVRTVLLLGKEKEGIPVNFLQVVDVCVDIPQLGIIRSLNVHVTGAVAIWEYTKQMMNRSTST